MRLKFLDSRQEIFLEQAFLYKVAWYRLFLRLNLLLDAARHASQLLLHVGFKERDLIGDGQVHVEVLCEFFCDYIDGSLGFVDVVGLDTRARLQTNCIVMSTGISSLSQ